MICNLIKLGVGLVGVIVATGVCLGGFILLVSILEYVETWVKRLGLYRVFENTGKILVIVVLGVMILLWSWSMGDTIMTNLGIHWCK